VGVLNDEGEHKGTGNDTFATSEAPTPGSALGLIILLDYKKCGCSRKKEKDRKSKLSQKRRGSGTVGVKEKDLGKGGKRKWAGAKEPGSRI